MKIAGKIFLVLIVLAVLIAPLLVLSAARLGGAVMPLALRPQMLAVAQLPPIIIRPQAVQVNLPTGVWDAPRIRPLQGGPGKLVMGDTYVLEEDETLEGSLVVMGGSATLKEGSRVDGDVVVLGGSVTAGGKIKGDVMVIGGLIELGDQARVSGDVNVVSGNLRRAEGARIEGDVNRSITRPGPVVIPGVEWQTGTMPMGLDLLGKVFWLGLRSVLWTVFALLVVLLFPNNSARASRALTSQPLLSGGLGLMVVIVAPLLLVVIAITIIGIPVTLVGVFLLCIAWAFGVIVVGLEIGKRLAESLKQEWAPAVSAGLGTFLVTFMANSVALIPCVGWMLPAAVGMFGLGAVLLTRFGMQEYLPYAPVRPANYTPEEVEPEAPAKPDEPPAPDEPSR